MSFGVLSPTQRKVLKPFISRRVVHDLGAGDLELSIQLVNLGAARVVAVDASLPPKRAVKLQKVQFVQVAFAYMKEKVRTAFVSWPWANHSGGLERVLSDVPTVIYLGNNFDGSACGSLELWRHLIARSVLVHEPHSKNSLIVYGEANGVVRVLLPEEEAALDWRNIRRFDDVYGRKTG